MLPLLPLAHDDLYPCIHLDGMSPSVDYRTSWNLSFGVVGVVGVVVVVVVGVGRIRQRYQS